MPAEFALPAVPQTGASSGATLLRRFTVVSLLATVAVGALFGTVAVWTVERYALDQHAHEAALYVSEFLAPRLVAQDFLVRRSTRRIQFVFALRGLIGTAGILRVSVWDARGRLLYSEAHGPAERAERTAPWPASPAAGIQSRIISLPPSAGPRRAMEVLVPIVLPGTARPVGLYDILSDVTQLETTLGRLERSLWASVLAGMLVLYVALFSIVRRASSELEWQHATLREAFAGVVQSLATAVGARDGATASHCTEVADLAVAIARAAGMNPSQVHQVRVAAFLHDVGKIGVRDEILRKRGPLTNEERAAIERHAVLGYEILLPVPIDDAIKGAVRHHHERWDGTGYPDRLAGYAIPPAARVIAVADAYGALTADRPYRPAQRPEVARAEIERHAGTQFDPRIVSAFRQVWEERARPAAAAAPARIRATP